MGKKRIAPQLNKPEGMAAFINAAINMNRIEPGTVEINWTEVLRDFQKHNCIAFGKWYSGMEPMKVEAAFERWQTEAPADEPVQRQNEITVEFKNQDKDNGTNI